MEVDGTVQSAVRIKQPSRVVREHRHYTKDKGFVPCPVPAKTRHWYLLFHPTITSGMEMLTLWSGGGIHRHTGLHLDPNRSLDLGKRASSYRVRNRKPSRKAVNHGDSKTWPVFIVGLFPNPWQVTYKSQSFWSVLSTAESPGPRKEP